MAELCEVEVGEQEELAAGGGVGVDREEIVHCEDSRESAVSESDGTLELGPSLLRRQDHDATTREESNLSAGICGMKPEEVSDAAILIPLDPFFHPPFLE